MMLGQRRVLGNGPNDLPAPYQGEIWEDNLQSSAEFLAAMIRKSGYQGSPDLLVTHVRAGIRRYMWKVISGQVPVWRYQAPAADKERYLSAINRPDGGGSPTFDLVFLEMLLDEIEVQAAIGGIDPYIHDPLPHIQTKKTFEELLDAEGPSLLEKTARNIARWLGIDFDTAKNLALIGGGIILLSLASNAITLLTPRRLT